MVETAPSPRDDRISQLARIAQAVGRSGPTRKGPAGESATRERQGWPTLWLFTDPNRTPDLLAAVGRLPAGAGVVLRSFGRPEALFQAQAVADLARARGLVLLVGADEALAQNIGADGLHLPERSADRLPGLRARFPHWRFTLAAHSAEALERARSLGAQAAFLSPVLPSRSPSAGDALGVAQASALAQAAGLPVYGLGGIDVETAPALIGSGLAGLAGVGFAAEAQP
jgi:thiamine-phosphate pyrophosphorylase